MKKSPLAIRCLIAFFLLAGIAAVLWGLNHYAGTGISPRVLLVARWIALAAFCGYALFQRSLTAWIAAGILLGAEIGADWPGTAVKLQFLSTIFLRLVKTIIAPLIFSTLVVGIAGHSNLKQVGRMGIKALIYFEIVTTFALFIGLAAINISKAGVGVNPQDATQAVTAQKQSATDFIVGVFPENIAKSIAEGQVLQVVIFSIIFAFALASVGEKRRRPMLDFFEGFSETMFKFTNIVMWFAPIGVAGAVAYTIGKMGFSVISHLLTLMATLYAALIVLALGVFLPIALIARLPVKRFVRAVAEPASIAFATASSEAALPRAMESMEAFGVPRQVVAFVIPTGYSFNLDGSSLYASLSAIFVAQAAGIHLSFGEQLAIVFTLMLTSKGVAGVPRAVLVILLGTVASFHLPEWPVFVLLGVDQLMDMGRTMINVVGNCLATAVIARWEGELGKEAPSPVVMDAVAQ
ncbi:MAG TPA: cation:dicarboxylase symporter family transporter [Candidatus Angelobacter sp.]